MQTVKINGKEIAYDFEGKLELHLSPYSYGVFDVIGKKLDDDQDEILYENAIVSFINPKGEDTNDVKCFVEIDGDEPYVVDCATYNKICSLKNLSELKTSVS